MSLAELMFQSASRAIETSKPDLAGAYQRGAQLAQAHASHQQKVQEHKDAQDLLGAKEDQFNIKDLETYSKLPPKLRSVYAKQMEAKALERGRPLAPEYIAGLKAVNMDPTEVSKFTNEYNEAFDEAMQLGKPTERLAAARAAVAETAYGGDVVPLTAFEQKEKRARIVAEGQAQRLDTQVRAREAAAQTAFQQTGAKKVATTAATNFTAYQAEGGKAGLNINLRELKGAAKLLESGAVTTGGISTKLPLLKSDEVQSILNQDMRNVQNTARSAIMPLLRATLGSAFTDAEGERIFGTVFDPKAPAKENAKRIRRKIEELEKTIGDKESLFIKEGFMKPGQQKEITSAKEDSFISDDQVSMMRGAYKQLTDAGKSPEEIFSMLKSAPSLSGASDQQLNAIIKKFQIEGK